MAFLERESQVHAVLGYAAEAAAGTGRLVLVEGEAGVGKSTLLEQVEARLPEATWHWGACDGLFTPLPLAPLRDIAEQVGGELRDACRSDASRAVLFDALVDAVRRAPGLTVLVVEDVHWADEATLDLLRHTGRRIQKERALLLVTFRDEEGGPGSEPLRMALGELARQRATRRVALPPLTRTAVQQLVAGTRLDAAEVHALTGGNPYFVAEVLGAGGERLPASARDAVLARVSRLDPAARCLLDAAALAGNRVDPALLEAVVGERGTGYDTLVAAGLLVTDGHALRFRHEIARLAVADAVPEPRRTTLHARILAALLDSGITDDSRLAFHAEGAGDTAALLRYASAAARRAAGLAAHREAIEHYRRALAASEDLAVDDRSRAEILDALATELGVVDHWAEAELLHGRALTLWRAVGDPLGEGESLRMRSRAFYRLARGAESEAAIEQALAVLEPLGPTPELARTIATLAGTAMVTGQNQDALAAVARGIPLTEQFGLQDVLADLLNTEAGARMGTDEEWAPTMQRALDVAVAAGCDEQAGRAYTNFYSGLVGEGRVAEGERLYLDGMKFCEDHEVHAFGNCLAATRVGALELTGRWAEGAALGWDWLAANIVSTNNWMHFALGLGAIGLRRGDEGTDDVIDRGLAAAEGTGEPQWQVPFRLLVAERHWIAGRSAEARAAVATALEVAATVPTEWDLAGRCRVWARRLGVPTTEAIVGLDLWESEYYGDIAGAVQRWDAVGAPYEAALALAFSPRTQDQVEALRRLEALGAVPVAAVVRRSLREAGVRSLPGVVRASTREHPAGLTAREQEVLEQLGRGCTNEEIAARLVISTKTAGHHVSAVLAKLGVPGRREAVAAAERLGLLPSADSGVSSVG